MNQKLTTISLPNGRKQSENGYLKLLVHFLHEHTIDDLRQQTIQDQRQFNDRFLLPHRIHRRRNCSTFIQNLVEKNADKKQLEIVKQLSILRSAIENAYRADSGICVHSVGDSLYKLIYLSSRPKNGWIDRDARIVSPETLHPAFEQFGGLYVLLDLLFLDDRFRNLGLDLPPAKQKFVFTYQARTDTFLFIQHLILSRDDLKAMLLKSEVLLTLLVNNYRRYGSDIRNSIAISFAALAKSQNNLEGVNFAGFVTSLTETAVASHTRCDTELISCLEAIEPFVDRSGGGRLDFLAVDGSIDMLIDLYSADCKKHPWHDLKHDEFQKFKLAKRILVLIAWDLHTNERALERFRQRDACRLLAQHIYYIRIIDIYWMPYSDRYWMAVDFLSLMIRGHQSRQIGDINVERRLLRELKIEKTIKIALAENRHSKWKSNYQTILRFLED